ncbi:MAG TPA: hypothetical protein VLJ37_11930 [bacterium]|nr:hypothetical protein [bacterium]
MFRPFLTLLLIVFSVSTAQAVTFTGNVDADFPPEACFADNATTDVGVPATFPAGVISGWDVDRICFLYNRPSDTLYVGIRTFDNGGVPVIFGDADGDGNPGGSRPELIAAGGQDFPNLSVEEYFALILDFDAGGLSDLGDTPEVVAGVTDSQQLPGGFRVSEVAQPPLSINSSFSAAYYGPAVASSSGSSVFVSPSAGAPHLEFTITGFSQLPGFSSIPPTNPDADVGLAFKDGSLGDDGIGDDEILAFLNISDFFDDDGDDVPNGSDPDSDNDGIPDVTEEDLDGNDGDGSCDLSPAEAAASGQDIDGDGDVDVNDAFTPNDQDGDGTPDFLDADTDNDGICDIWEGNTQPFDANGDGVISPDEFDTIDQGGNYPGGNGDGCVHGNELPDTDGDGTDDFRDLDSDGDGLPDADEAGSGAQNCGAPTDTDGDGTPDYRDPDSDNDGLPDGDEGPIGTDPLDPDSDDDGVSDGEEVAAGDDPLYPGEGLDPDVSVPNSGQAVQIQGSGFGGCSLIHD